MSELKYELIDCGDFEKLERIGPTIFRRPSPQAVWSKNPNEQLWKNPHAQFIRRSDGNGDWKYFNKDIPPFWDIEHYQVKLRLMCTGFGHTGAFFEQGPNWEQFRDLINTSSKKPFRVLNLFAYTGGATVACAQAGAEVVHLDASKTSVTWAKENAQLNGLEDAPIRYIAEDVKSFIAREIRRGSQYEAIILDPPSFGRGTKKQVWKIEEDMIPLLSNLTELKSPQFKFVSLSSHSQGYTPLALENLLSVFGSGKVSSMEMTVPCGDKALPSGATAIMRF